MKVIRLFVAIVCPYIAQCAETYLESQCAIEDGGIVSTTNERLTFKFFNRDALVSTQSVKGWAENKIQLLKHSFGDFGDWTTVEVTLEVGQDDVRFEYFNFIHGSQARNVVLQRGCGKEGLLVDGEGMFDCRTGKHGEPITLGDDGLEWPNLIFEFGIPADCGLECDPGDVRFPDTLAYHEISLFREGAEVASFKVQGKFASTSISDSIDLGKVEPWDEILIEQKGRGISGDAAGFDKYKFTYGDRVVDVIQLVGCRYVWFDTTPDDASRTNQCYSATVSTEKYSALRYHLFAHGYSTAEDVWDTKVSWQLAGAEIAEATSDRNVQIDFMKDGRVVATKEFVIQDTIYDFRESCSQTTERQKWDRIDKL